MISPSDKCKCHQKTVFFKYPSFIEQDLRKLNISELIIKDKEYFVGGLLYFNKNITNKNSLKSLREALNNNNIVRLFHEEGTNLYWKGNNEYTDLKFSKYQKYNNNLKHTEITRKDLLYKNYKIMKNIFPDDFNYLPETYIDNLKQLKNIFKNYKISKDNLWLIKSKYLSRGRNIRFLKDVNEISKNDIVTKYISNPLLIDNRKFDLRIYLLVTGHDPLKIYLFHKGLVRMSSEQYNLDLNDLDNLFKHLTNTSINKKNKNGYKYDDLVLSLEEAKKYMEKKYNINFSNIWKEIKDISIKSLISMNHLEIEREKKYKLISNNLFKIYGVDILIDDNFKPWLIEINHGPDLSTFNSKNHAKITKYEVIHDILNIIGLVPFSHINGNALEGECTYKNSIDEAIDQSICEFTRPLGGFERIFPLKENIKVYKKYFRAVSLNNKALWNVIEGKKNEDEENINWNETKRKQKINEKFKEKFPQFEKINSQNLLMVSPSPQCKINQRTIFFKYHKFIGDNLNDRVSKMTINNAEYFVGSVQRFGRNVKYSPSSIKKVLNDNGIIRLYENEDTNLYWRSSRKNSYIPKNINKYQKYNHMLMFHEITRKNLLYKNYDLFKRKFPEHYNFMPETFTYENFDEVKNKFKNYKLSNDNLWLIKPQNSLQGSGIRFLKNISDVKKNELVTKYISDPLLINGRKFDIRFHVLVTGHNPLKIYIHSIGFIKLSSEMYDLDINNIDNVFKHVTNLGLNIKNKNKKLKMEELIVSLEKAKEYLRKTYNLNFNIFLEDVKDIIIKSVITMNHIELEKEKEYKLSSNNIFDLYGVDIMIDSKFKPWLLEININPFLGEESLTLDRKKMLRQTLIDTFNILGMVPYSHINGTAYESESKFKNSADEAVQQSICEFTRPLGGFNLIFPLKSNIDYYKKFFKTISTNNQALWDELQNK